MRNVRSRVDALRGPQARRDKVKTREYQCRITVECLAAAQARLQDLDLVTQKQRELKENPVG